MIFLKIIVLSGFCDSTENLLNIVLILANNSLGENGFAM
jgi:hypothetical protein